MSDNLIPVPDDFDLGQTIRGFVAGQTLGGRYTLAQVLGRGGMGVVWLAQDEKLERQVALKFLPEMVTHDKEAISDLKRETKRSLELTHPNIVRIYDFVQDSTWAGISMEYVSGETLSALKVGQPNRCFEVGQITTWVQQLCAALTYAHTEAEVVHRDLKPANLMMDAKGRLKIADFGIARSISDSVSRVSVRSATSGTLGYMSPQQARGQGASIADDVYSLGATLYDLLGGKPPFYTGEIYQQLLHEIPGSMAERRAQLGIVGEPIPAEWEEVVAACLAKEPEQRPQSISEIAERLGLGSVTTGTKRSARVEVPATVSASPEPPKKSKAMLIAVVILLLIGGACLGWYFGVEQPAAQEKLRQAEIAQQEAIQKEKDAEAKAAADAAEKARLEAQAKQAADDAERLKTEAEKAKALADQKAAADAVAAKAAADQKAADDAAVAKAAADQKTADDAAKALADQKAKDDAAKAASDAAAAKALADQKAKDDAAKALADQKAKAAAVKAKIKVAADSGQNFYSPNGSLQDNYLQVYVRMHDSENLEKQGDKQGAAEGFRACLNTLLKIQQTDPTWESALVTHRIEDCRITINRLEQ